MRAPAVVLAAALFAALAFGAKPALAQTVDVVIQAGHQGRPQSCIVFRVRACNLGAQLGTQLERDWTPIVADATAAELRTAGLRVKRRPADYADRDTARAAVFFHFDGSSPACRSGASVGFPATTAVSFVAAWETYYRRIFPFRFVGRNFTKNESAYYGFRKVDAPGKTLLIEFGELTCPAQARWLAPRLHELGVDVARFLIEQLRA